MNASVPDGRTLYQRTSLPLVKYDVFWGTSFICAVIGYYMLRILLPRWRNIFRVDASTSKFVFITSCDDSLGRKLAQSMDHEGFGYV